MDIMVGIKGDEWLADQLERAWQEGLPVTVGLGSDTYITHVTLVQSAE